MEFSVRTEIRSRSFHALGDFTSTPPCDPWHVPPSRVSPWLRDARFRDPRTIPTGYWHWLLSSAFRFGGDA